MREACASGNPEPALRCSTVGRCRVHLRVCEASLREPGCARGSTRAPLNTSATDPHRGRAHFRGARLRAARGVRGAPGVRRSRADFFENVTLMAFSLPRGHAGDRSGLGGRSMRPMLVPPPARSAPRIGAHAISGRPPMSRGRRASSKTGTAVSAGQPREAAEVCSGRGEMRSGVEAGADYRFREPEASFCYAVRNGTCGAASLAGHHHRATRSPGSSWKERLCEASTPRMGFEPPLAGAAREFGNV